MTIKPVKATFQVTVAPDEYIESCNYFLVSPSQAGFLTWLKDTMDYKITPFITADDFTFEEQE